MRVTEKGQVTIPKPIRDRLGIGPGSEVDFVHRNGTVFVEARRGETGSDDPSNALLRHIEKHAGSFDFEGLQSDDVMRLLRD